MGKKLLVTVALTGAMLVLPASAAFAHDCFIANRSGAGSVGAGHSAVATGFTHGWVTIDIAAEFANAEVDDVDAAMADWLALGHKAFYSTRIDALLGEGTGADRNGLMGNGKGLDLFSQSSVFEDFVEVVLAHGGALPEEEE